MDHIKKPYLISAVKKAIKAAVIAIILLVLNILLINRTLLSGIEVSFLQLILGAVILVVLSVVIYYSTTYSSTNTFLKKYKITQK